MENNQPGLKVWDIIYNQHLRFYVKTKYKHYVTGNEKACEYKYITANINSCIFKDISDAYSLSLFPFHFKTFYPHLHLQVNFYTKWNIIILYKVIPVIHFFPVFSFSNSVCAHGYMSHACIQVNLSERAFYHLHWEPKL